MNSIQIQEVLGYDFEQDKYILPLILPMVEEMIAKSQHSMTSFYRPLLQAEIAKFKTAIKYDEMAAEEKANMQLAHKDPAALDKKLGIIRDEWGRVVSRDGVPDPYYQKANPDYCVPFNKIKDVKFDMNDPKLTKLMMDAEARADEEEANTRERAAKYLEKVKQHPTTNFYEMPK